jgi:hypothetical protein
MGRIKTMHRTGFASDRVTHKEPSVKCSVGKQLTNKDNRLN